MNNGIHVEDELSALLDGESAAAPEVEAHLRACPECARRYQELRAVTTQVRRLRAPEVQPEFVARVLKQVRDEAREEAAAPWWKQQWWTSLWHPAPMLAFSAAAAVLVGIVAYRALEVTAPQSAGTLAQSAAESFDTGAAPAAVRELSAAGLDVTELADSMDDADGLNAALENGLDENTASQIENEFLAMLDAGWADHGDDAFAALDELSPDDQDALLGLLQGDLNGETNEG